MWDKVYDILMIILVGVSTFFYKKSFFDKAKNNFDVNNTKIIYLAGYLIVTLNIIREIIKNKLYKKRRELCILLVSHSTLTFFSCKAFLTNYSFIVNFPYVVLSVINFTLLSKYIQKLKNSN